MSTRATLLAVLRNWVVILAAWAVVVQASASTLPVTAVAHGHQLCVATGDAGPTGPQEAPDQHGSICCILCQVASAAALPPTVVIPLPVPEPQAAPIRPMADTAAPRAPPPEIPRTQRAPPVLV